MKAKLSNYRQAPRKVRLVARMIQGKTAAAAAEALSFLPRRAALPIKRLLNSAVANASPLQSENLTIKKITVDKGMVFKRHNPVSRGRAHPIKKRTSHIVLELAEILN